MTIHLNFTFLPSRYIKSNNEVCVEQMDFLVSISAWWGQIESRIEIKIMQQINFYHNYFLHIAH